MPLGVDGEVNGDGGLDRPYLLLQKNFSLAQSKLIADKSTITAQIHKEEFPPASFP